MRAHKQDCHSDVHSVLKRIAEWVIDKELGVLPTKAKQSVFVREGAVLGTLKVNKKDVVVTSADRTKTTLLARSFTRSCTEASGVVSTPRFFILRVAQCVRRWTHFKTFAVDGVGGGHHLVCMCLNRVTFPTRPMLMHRTGRDGTSDDDAGGCGDSGFGCTGQTLFTSRVSGGGTTCDFGSSFPLGGRGRATRRGLR